MKIFSRSVFFCLLLGLWGCDSSGGGSQNSVSEPLSYNQTQVQFNYEVRSKYLPFQLVEAPATIIRTNRSYSATARSISQWPEYKPPALSSTQEGPFDFSDNRQLWFNINYTNEVGVLNTYLVKLSGSIGENPSAITTADIFFQIAQVVENNLIVSQSPLTITGPSESGGKIEIIPVIEQGFALNNIGFSAGNRLSTGGISGTSESPQLISTATGSFDLSGDKNLWFSIHFTPESEETQSYQIKLDNTVGAFPSNTTQAEVYEKISAAVGSNLIISHSPLAIKAPVDSVGTLVLAADIELDMTLTSLGFAEGNRLSTGDGNGSVEQYSGTLTVYNQASHEYQYFPWAIYIEQHGFTVLSNSTLTLSPGSYTLSLLVSHSDRQYGGEGSIEVGEDNQLNFELPLAPIVGAVDANVTDISVYSMVQVHFDLAQLNYIDIPRLGIFVNGDNEFMFDVSKIAGVNRFYLNTLDTVENFYLKFYDDTHLIAKSDSFNADLLYSSSDASAAVELYPLVSEINFSFVNDEQFPSHMTLTIPADIIDELGPVENLITIITIAGSETPFQQYTINELSAVNDGYQGTTNIEISSFENLAFELAFSDRDTQNVLGGCSSHWSVSSFAQTLICATKLVGDNVLYTSLKSTVSINTVSILGNPIEGVIVKDQYDTTWGISGHSSHSPGYLSFRVLPGDYVLTGTLNGEVVVTQSLSVGALEAKNTTLVINDASALAYPNTGCRQLRIDNSTLPSGFYTIDVDGPSVSDGAVNANHQVVYCNMTMLNGGWTLVGYHGDNLPWKTVSTVSPEAYQEQGSGLLADIFWNSLKYTITEGMMLIDDAGNVSMISAETLNAATCINPITDINSLVNVDADTRIVFLTNDSQCDLTYATRSAVVLKSNSQEGVNLIKGTDDVFEIWPYTQTQSKDFHTGMWIYIK